MTKWFDQEELTLLLDAGRNICCLCWGAEKPFMAKMGFAFGFCKNSWTCHCK